MPDTRHPAAQPHDPLRELLPGIHYVHGSMRIGPAMRISRNMVVLEDGGELTLVNAVRLSAAGEAALHALGRVRRVVRLGFFHGLDDRYYVERFDAEFLVQARSTHYPEPQAAVLLQEGVSAPIAGAELFEFREARFPECALLLRAHGGVLVCCDAVQHWPDWSRCSLAAIAAMRLMGFRRGTQIGPLWKKHMTPRGGSLEPDYRRLLEHEFEHLLGAHGGPLHDGARRSVREAVARVYG